MKRILVPTDFSEQSRFALVAAAGLAELAGASINLLHVIEKGEDEEAARRMLHEQSRMLALESLHIERFVSNGSDVEQITHFKSDMIVMGSKGAHGLKSFFLGTHAESVAKHAVVPVITIKGPTDLRNLSRIIFATDMGDGQEEIMEDLIFFQRLYKASLHLVKVYDDDSLKSSEVEKQMRRFAEEQGLKNYSVTARPGSNEIQEIMGFANEVKADIVAMATHDRHGLERLFGGIISGTVINQIDLPIWTKAILYSD